MNKLLICAKPFSVNKAWKGKRYRSEEYNDFEEEVMYLLPRGVTPIEGPVMVHYKFHIKSHKTADNDNPVKTIQDVLVKAGILIDDRFIYRTIADKIPCLDAQDERIEVEITPFEIPLPYPIEDQ